MPLFSLSLDSFKITDTRSVHTDTNYGSITYLVPGEFAKEDTAYNSPQYGNYNNGTYKGNLICAGVSVQPNLPLTFNYLILNAGFTTPDKAHAVLEDVGSAMVQGPALPAFASCLGQVAAQYANTFNTVLRPGCDGLVAAEQISFAYEDLVSRTSGRPATFTHTTTHIGPTIAHSCNPRPSHYIVNWSVSQVVAVPQVANELTEDKAKAALAALSLQESVQKGNPTGAKAYVISQSIAAGTLVPLGTNVALQTSLTAR